VTGLFYFSDILDT